MVGGVKSLGALSVTGGTGTTALYKTLREHDGASMSFIRPVRLQNSIAMDTLAANGNLSFSTTLDALAAGGQGLTITAGTGNVGFIGVVGGVKSLGALR